MRNYNSDYFNLCVQKTNKALNRANKEEAIAHILSLIALSLASIADVMEEQAGINHEDDEVD